LSDAKDNYERDNAQNNVSGIHAYSCRSPVAT